MAVSSIGSSDSLNYVESTDSTSTSSTGLSVDMDTFLKLLVAQLQYQDPLEPQENTDFVTQLAQMTSLEQMQQMNGSLSGTKAFDMIGKYVYAEALDQDTGVTNCYLGYVDSVIYKDGEYYAVVQDNAISISDILQVFDAESLEAAAAAQAESSDAASEETADAVAGG